MRSGIAGMMGARGRWIRQQARYLNANFDASTILGVTPHCWLRADTTVNAGGFVSQMTDKSGNGRHFAQATGSKQPALVAAGSDPNGFACALSDGSDDGLTNAGFGAMTHASIFMVMRSLATPASSVTLFGIGTASDAQSLKVVTSGATARVVVRYDNPGSTFSSRNVDSTSVMDATFGSSSIKMLSIVHDSSASASATPTTRSRLGTPVTANTGTSATISTIANLGAGIFANKSAASLFSSFGLYELIAFDRACTSDEQRKVELMLAGYYGLL